MTGPDPTKGDAALIGTMTHTKAVVAKLAAVPAEKRQSKLLRTILGVLIGVIGWYAKTQFPNLPDLVAFGTVAFGFVMASGEYIAAPFRLFVGLLRDLVGAVRNGNGGAA